MMKGDDSAGYQFSSTKQSNDHSASALMLNIIRTLTNVSSNDQKQIDCQRLEAGFNESSTAMDKLVHEHENDVGTCLDSFKSVSTRITNCRERIHSVCTGLTACRSLLQCRRDDLKRLWTENAQQRHISNVLAQIEQLKKVETDVDETITKADYLAAANLLNNADHLLNGPFSNIEGLCNLRGSIHQASKKLVVHITDELTILLIVRPFQYQLLEIIRSLPDSKVSESVECAEILKSFIGLNSIDQNRSVTQVSNNAAISSQFKRSIRALCVFNHLNSTLSRYIQLMPSFLLRQIQLTAAVVCVAFNSNSKGDVEHLSQYLHLILNQLKSSYEVHLVFDSTFEEMKGEVNDCESVVLPSKRFWDMGQDVIEKVVVEYVQIDAITSNTSKKVSNNTDKFALFKFESCACAVSLRNTQTLKQLQSTICEPSPWNITTLYPLLERFCCERESISNDRPCKLRKFLHSFIVDVFIDRFKSKLELLAEQALHGRDAWRLVVHYPNPKILASCYNMFEVCEEIGKLIKTMENYTERLSALWLLVIDEFTKSAVLVYERILNPADESEKEHRKISAAWAVDEDISRLLKSLPNWFAVSHHESTPTPSTVTPTVLPPGNESESEIRQRNERESEILIGNLGTAKQLAREELITDMELICSLASIHESLKWFSSSMRSLISSLPESCRQSMRKCIIQIQSVQKNSISQQESICAAVERRLLELDSVADTCLLIIHIELRVHCFFHLLPLARARAVLPHDELDNEVIDLGRDLTHFHQTLHMSLPAHKMKYLFDGLGHLSASIFIHSSQHIQRLTENGKKRVCRNIFAVQQRLSHLTGRRESELERARAFFELLNHDPDQLLALILERGAVFSHLEYTYLLALAVRSHPTLSTQPGALEQRMTQLKQILSQIRRS